MHNDLLVVAKQPLAGQTKTRLCPPLTREEAADLYECFLLDTLQIMRSVPGVRRTIVYLPLDAQAYFRALAPDMDCMPQRGASLGERLDNLLGDRLDQGADKAVVIDSDSPTLPGVYLVQAFEQLDDADIVLGPTADGGYYLIGMKKPHPHLLRQVQMSTPQVLQDTLNLAQASNLKTALLPTWYDIDTLVDLHKLRAEVTPSKNGLALHTHRWLSARTW